MTKSITNVNEDYIKEKFYASDLDKQVAIYAEALKSEKYELLARLKNLIRPIHKKVFQKMVGDYLVAKYGRR